MFETHALRQQLAQPQESDNQWRVLATITQTEGSTYRGPGAKLLIDKSGQMTGVISGGCFDSALYNYAQECQRRQGWLEAVFDLRDEDDAIFGTGLGCQGMIRLLLEPLPPSLSAQQIDLILGDPAADQPQAVMVVFEATGTVSRQELDASLPGYDQSQLLGDGKFLDVRKPRLRLNVIGCGPDAIPVARFADALGWRLRMVDHREIHLQRTEFPADALRLCLRPNEFFQTADFSSYDAVLVMSHNFAIDLEAVVAASQTRVSYVGVLGPEMRGDRLRKEVEAQGQVADGFWQRFYNPVGLDIGSENAAEIALSAVAEVNALFFGKSQNHLRARGRCDHEH